jgi:D-glycero-D-manno-heptose 1,7-bisphosphate phosphatase
MRKAHAGETGKQARSSWAVFVDRDGTIIEELGYLSDPDKVRLMPDAAASISKLNRKGIPVVIISNQAGVARGLFTQDDLERVNERVLALLASRDAHVDAAYYCPHHPDFDVDCACRKPRPGLLLKAASDMGIDLSRSFMVGDRLIDMQAGKSAGTSTVFLRTGYGRKELEESRTEVAKTADRVCDDLAQAVDWILDERF